MQYRAALLRAGLALSLLAACQRGDKAGDWRSSPLGRDLDRICNAVEQSGASQQPAGDRQLLVAQWLGARVESQDGRNFLAELARLQGAAKATALEDKAGKVGLATCPLAEVWRAQ